MNLQDIGWLLLSMAGWFVAMALAFSWLARCSPCNPGQSRGRAAWLTDCAYYFLVPFVTRYVRLIYLGLLFAAFFTDLSGDELVAYFEHGFGPMGRLPMAAQIVLILLISDFMLYWLHRGFHSRAMWRFHAIHHSSEEVDWLSAFRFHPVNTWLSFTLVDVAMLAMGFSPAAFALMAPFNVLYSGFVHANVNYTLGPLRYVLASPVFHRWHHTHSQEGGNRNFAPTFPFLDLMFGTFYMPKGQLPEHYGVDRRDVPAGFADQLLYPFKAKRD